MGGNKDNMRQAMKELLGLVGFGPEEKEGEAQAAERPAPAARPAETPRPAQAPVAETPVAPKIEREPAVERPAPKIEREPAVERPAPKRAAEKPVAEEPATKRPVEKPVVEQPVVQKPVVEEPVARRPIVEQPVAQKPVAQKPVVEEPVARRPIVEQPVVQKPVVEEPAPVVETVQRRAEPAPERGFFSFGRKDKAKEPAPARQESVFETPARQSYTPPVEKPFAPPMQTPPAYGAAVQGEDTIRAPFIRPGATVIAAGATFFGDIRAEGDVEVLGKVKGNLEATGNIRVTGKVLGDVKGEAVKLEGCTVQGNITSTSFVSLDAGAMVVGDVLATDFQSNGKIKGNLQIARAASFSSCALLAGNVIAATIMMAQGTRVQGAVRIAEDPETNSLFGELEI